MSVSKTNFNIQIKNKMANPIQKTVASSNAANEDLEDMDVLCTFKIKLESPNSINGYTAPKNV